MTKILVAYASKHHATAGIAEAIGETLRQGDDVEVDVRSVEAVHDITPYDGVVVGSAVYVGQWQTEAADFLKKHESALAQRPVWLFSSGPTGEGDAESILKGWTFPEALQPVVEHIKPRDVKLFHGKLDMDSLNFFERTTIRVVKAPVGDYRDWDDVESWAKGIAQAV